MNKLEKWKDEYEKIPVPQELDSRVQAGIREGKRRRRQKVWRRSLGTAAACLVLVAGVLNLAPPVAAAAAEIPLLGGLFQILTIRSYDETKDGIDYSINAPGVAPDSDLARRVNQEIQTRVDDLMDKAQEDWAEYQEAFFATGGTREEWGDRQMDVIVDYEIRYQTDTVVSFTVDFGEGWISGGQERYCYNLDLAEGRDITLANLLGEDWAARCNAAVERYMEENADFSYFFPPETGGFTTVDEETAFYIRQDGIPVLVFQEYSIAAGAAGIVEIPTA